MEPPPWPSRCRHSRRAGLNPARPRPSGPPNRSGTRLGRGREAQAEARASSPDPGSFAVSLAREASVLALAGAGRRWGWGKGGAWEKDFEAVWIDSQATPKFLETEWPG